MNRDGRETGGLSELAGRWAAAVRRERRGSSIRGAAARRRPAAAAAVAGGSADIVVAAGPPGERRRELVLTAITVVAVSWPAEGPLVWLVAGLTFVAVLIGARRVLAGSAGSGGLASMPAVPIESVLTPAVAAFGCVGAIRLVPPGIWLVPALGLAWLLLDRTLRTEERILAAAHGPTAADRTALLVEALVVAFVAFAGVAAIVPGGLPEPGPAGVGAVALSEGSLVALVAGDAIVAGLLGYRASALRVATLRDGVWSAATYAGAIGVAAAALRAMDIPRLIGPAILTLVLFLWDAFHAAPPSRRRDPRWLWQTALLVLLGLVIVAWNLRLRS